MPVWPAPTYDAHREQFGSPPGSFDEARGDVLLKLRGQAQAEARKAMIAQLGGTNQVTVDKNALDRISDNSPDLTRTRRRPG